VNHSTVLIQQRASTILTVCLAKTSYTCKMNDLGQS
jgi:hypothetical protein